MSHSDILKLLMPIYLDTCCDEDIELEGLHLDLAQASAEVLLTEMFPGTAEILLSRWEEIYGILVDESKPLFQRRQNLLAKINARAGLSRIHIQTALRPYVGYDVDIEEYHVPRCDDPGTLTDDERYAMDDQLIWQFTVYIDNSLLQTVGYAAADIQKIIDQVKPAHTQGILNTGIAGFFADHPDSLTDSTLLAL